MADRLGKSLRRKSKIHQSLSFNIHIYPQPPPLSPLRPSFLQLPCLSSCRERAISYPLSSWFSHPLSLRPFRHPLPPIYCTVRQQGFEITSAPVKGEEFARISHHHHLLTIENQKTEEFSKFTSFPEPSKHEGRLALLALWLVDCRLIDRLWWRFLILVVNLHFILLKFPPDKPHKKLFFSRCSKRIVG
jgi:hypothetical protein